MRTSVFLLAIAPLFGASSIPKITLNDLENLQDVGALKDEGGKIGVFQVTNLPSSFVQSHEKLLSDAPNCLNRKTVHHSHMDLPRVRMADGSMRITAASEEGKLPSCLHMEGMLAVYDKIDALVARVIDKAVGQDLGYVTGSEKHPVLLANAPVKDHVHLYEEAGEEGKDQDVHSGDFMVPYHADNGMYLILSPFKGSGLSVKLSNGKAVSTSDLGPGSLLVLVGRGLTEWLLQDGGFEDEEMFYPVLHAVPRLNVHQRTVYARMKVAPQGAIPAKLKRKVGSDRVRPLKSFHDVFTETVEHPGELCSVRISKGSVPEASPNNAWLRAMDSLCHKGQAYCWMGCMPLPHDCQDPDEAKCFNPENNVTCRTHDGGPGPMDNGCSWHCKENSTVINDFCNELSSMDMLMGGFEPAGNKANNCIILWISPFTLNTRAKFYVACVGVVFLGIAIEASIAIRRRFSSVRRSSPHLPVPRSFRTFAGVMLFGVNLFLGYLAMLVAMTYSVELFFCVILGLMIGHAALNLKVPVSESVDPCCPPQEADTRDLIGGGVGNSEEFSCDGPCTRGSFGLIPSVNDEGPSTILRQPDSPPPYVPEPSAPRVSVKTGGGCNVEPIA